MLSEAQIDQYRRDGYLIMRGNLTGPEVEGLREACQRHGGPGSVLGRPGFTELLFDERIVEPLKQLLGPQLVHFGEASGRFDDRVVNSRSRHFHNDSRGDDFDFSQPYPLIRIGVYLQDHSRCSGGLKLRPGSFDRICRERMGWRRALRLCRRELRHLVMGRSLNVPSRPGDVVLCNLRIHHSGYAVRLRGLPDLSLHPRLENLVPTWAEVAPERPRSVVFATFGAPSEYLERFIEDRVRHVPELWLHSDFDRPHVHALARRAGVTLRLDGLVARGERGRLPQPSPTPRPWRARG